MVLLAFLCFLALAVTVAFLDWRRGVVFMLVCAPLQDVVRKLTPGNPVVLTMSIVAIYFMIIFTARRVLKQELVDFSRRFGGVYRAALLVMVFVVLAAFTGIVTFGLGLWKVPALSLFIYTAPIPAIVLGYAYAQREEQIATFFRFYAIITAVALIGTPLEFWKVQWNALGMVGLPQGFIRHLPGLQIRLLSGFYRAPDIMGWHAAMLTIIGITLALRGRVIRAMWPWALLAGWGFFNCILSGRRKAVYMVAAFALVFVWRYIRRLTVAQAIAFALVGMTMLLVVNNLSSKEESNVYTRGTITSRAEVIERLEGGVVETVEQFGFMGAGLGTATQGVRHLLGTDQNVGWQEAGLGKLTIELGVPGLIAVAFAFFVMMRALLLMSGYPDEEGSSQLMRCALFGIFAACVANFLASAQAYSDAGLTIVTAFLLGNLLATAALHDRLTRREAEPAQVAGVGQLVAAAAAN
ncbi:MAG TPA: hypothetical protein VFN10_06655 [Thermoanaerobaculia bacterium]|nr:hypothetical protein [Thermoanaerobaculia bacterium]